MTRAEMGYYLAARGDQITGLPTDIPEEWVNKINSLRYQQGKTKSSVKCPRRISDMK